MRKAVIRIYSTHRAVSPAFLNGLTCGMPVFAIRALHKHLRPSVACSVRESERVAILGRCMVAVLGRLHKHLRPSVACSVRVRELPF